MLALQPGNGAGFSHAFASDTNDGFHEVSGMASVDEFYYALVSRDSGQALDHADVLNVANAFLGDLGSPVAC